MNKPSQRPSYRYLKIKIHSEEKIEFEELLESYWETVPVFIGLKNHSKSKAWLIKNTFNTENQEVVLRVEKSFEEEFEAALTLLDSFQGKKGFISVENVSGSISNLKK